jgi:hypothetical protein
MFLFVLVQHLALARDVLAQVLVDPCLGNFHLLLIASLLQVACGTRPHAGHGCHSLSAPIGYQGIFPYTDAYQYRTVWHKTFEEQGQPVWDQHDAEECIHQVLVNMFPLFWAYPRLLQDRQRAKTSKGLHQRLVAGILKPAVFQRPPSHSHRLDHAVLDGNFNFPTARANTKEDISDQRLVKA